MSMSRKTTLLLLTWLLCVPVFADVADVPAGKPSIDMVFVKGGKFKMGCPNLDGSGCVNDERPRHEVKVNNFFIGKYPVTQKQWVSVMGVNPSHFIGDDLPVEQVSWDDVQEFIKRLNAITGKKYRLLTEAEWEYAAQGGAKDTEKKGKNEKPEPKFLADVAWYEYNSGGRTRPAGTREPNELGVYDMIGNVWEWVNDRYDGRYYLASPFSNPMGPKHGQERVYRGGSFSSFESQCRISLRNYAKSDYRTIYLGFRLARTP